MDEGIEPVLHHEAQIIRSLKIGESAYLGMIEITRLATKATRK